MQAVEAAGRFDRQSDHAARRRGKGCRVGCGVRPDRPRMGFAGFPGPRHRYVDTTRANFLKSLDISCYSFTAVARRAAHLMAKGGSLVTLTYLGAQRVMPNYNVMGVAKAALEASVRYLAADLGRDNIRVNAISAGPMRTLAGSAVGDARMVFKWNKT